MKCVIIITYIFLNIKKCNPNKATWIRNCFFEFLNLILIFSNKAFQVASIYVEYSLKISIIISNINFLAFLGIPYKGTQVPKPHFQQIDDMERFPLFNLKFKQ